MSITSSQSNRNSQKFRIVFLGDMGVGKSAIIERYTNNKFNESHMATVGIDFSVKDVTKNGQYYRLQMWDTAGQQRYRSLIPTYLKNAHCVIFVFDVTKPTSLQNIRAWHKMFVQNQQAPGFLVANKIDLTSARKVTRTQAQTLCKQLKLGYEQVSAKSGKKIQDLFIQIIDRILNYKNQQNDPQTSRQRFQQGQDSQKQYVKQQKKYEEQGQKQKNIKLNKKKQGILSKLNCCST